MRRYRHQSLLPPGLVIQRVEFDVSEISAIARARSASASCPLCGRTSTRIHSRYERCLADLPAHGRRVRIRLVVRRFRCSEAHCQRKIFAERFEEEITRPFARRTARLESIVHHLGLALGGRPGQSLARRLLFPVSKDTLLRVVRSRAPDWHSTPQVVGIDDWAWKRGHRYGTIVCDLERRRIIDLLPDREVATVQAWLSDRPSIRTISRDRGGGYSQAATRGRPQAIQIADRWHLMENASAAFLTAVRHSLHAIRVGLRAGVSDPTALTSVEQRQYEAWCRREAANATIRTLAGQGVSIKGIVRHTGQSRKVVRDVLRGGRTDVFRPRASSLDPFLGQLEAEWAAGCRSGTELWRRLRASGFPGALRVVTEWATRRRADGGATTPRRVPAARVIVRMMTLARDQLTKGESSLMTRIEAIAPALVVARDLTDRFHALIRTRDGDGLDPWIDDADSSLLASFASGIRRDRDAICNAIVEPWSNGQTEGQITKLKLVKRQMYGRAKLDLLRARLLGAA
jgi:transposase